MAINVNKEKQKSPPLSQKINDYICPIMLGCSLCYSIVYALYREMAIPCAVLFFFFELILFRFFDRLHKNKIKGGIIYTVILFVLLFLSIALLTIGQIRLGRWGAASAWFYGEDEFDHHQPLFLAALFIGGGYFLISILYYFSQLQYRRIGLMLCILFPFIIYAKRSNNMPELMVTVIITLYLAVVIHNKQYAMSSKSSTAFIKVDRSYIISLAVFVSVTGAIVVSVDRPVYRSKLEVDASYFDYGFGASGNGLENYEYTSTQSGQRYGQRNYTGKELFTFTTNGTKSVYYLISQTFTTFDGNIWSLDYSNREWKVYSTPENPEYSTNDILADMQTLVHGTGAPPESLITIDHGKVYNDEFSPIYLPAPYGTITDDKSINDLVYSKYAAGIILRLNFTDNIDFSVYNLNDEFDFYEQTPELYEYAYALGMSGEEYREALTSVGTIPAKRLLKDFDDAKENYSDRSFISNEVQELAKKITAGCKSDIEKAIVLESYFEDNGYVYDEKYNPSDKSIDYFIFEGKTGVCTSYATAMTLMARSVGLTARYTEGFAAFEKNDNGDFVIRDQHAHAFVEVYIPGAGWLTFDPTVSGYMDIKTEADNSSALSALIVLSRFSLVILSAVVIIYFLLWQRIFELFFRTVQLFRKPEQAVVYLYANVIRLLNNNSSGTNYSSFTVRRLSEYLLETRGCVPEKLFALFEKTSFGGYVPSKQEYKEAYKEYRECFKYLITTKRKKQSE